MIQKLFASFNGDDFTIIFGNLGRHPALLDHYIKANLCFDRDTKIVLTCTQKGYSSEFWVKEIPQDAVDYLFIVEPYFGYTVHRHLNVRHLIVLTSHLCMTIPTRAKLRTFYLSAFANSTMPELDMRECVSWKPPLFHRDGPEIKKSGPVLMDVSEAKTVHEAFLRALTGYEMIRGRLFSFRMNEYQKVILRRLLKSTNKEVKIYFPHEKTWLNKLCDTLFAHINLHENK